MTSLSKWKVEGKVGGNVPDDAIVKTRDDCGNVTHR